MLFTLTMTGHSSQRHVIFYLESISSCILSADGVPIVSPQELECVTNIAGQSSFRCNQSQFGEDNFHHSLSQCSLQEKDNNYILS